jgi:HK97 family phage portal protein
LYTALSGGSISNSNVRVNEQTALALSAFFAAGNAISSDIATFPRWLIEEIEEESTKRHRDLLGIENLLNFRPNPEATAATFWQAYLMHAVVWGNAYCEIVRNGFGVVTDFWLLDPESVTIMRNEVTGELAYRVQTSLISHAEPSYITLTADSVLHMAGASFNGLTGARWVQLAKDSLGVGIAAQDYNGTFMGKAATPSGIIEIPDELSKEAYNRLRRAFAQRHEGTTNAGATVILEDGATWKQISSDPEKAQLSETRLFTIEEVGRWFRMPLSKLQHLVNSGNHNSLEQLDKEYLSDSLMPWISRFGQVLKKQMFTPLPQAGKNYFIKFDTKSRQQGDSIQISEIQREQINAGAMTPNEARKENGKNPVPDEEGGNKTWMQTAMAPTSLIIEREELKLETIRLTNEKLKLELEGMADEPEPEPAPTTDELVDEGDTEGDEEESQDSDQGTLTTTDDIRSLAKQVLSEISASTVVLNSTLIDGLEEAQLPVFKTTYQRLLHLEHDKATRAQKRDGLSTWIKEFYPKHSTYVKAALVTPVESFCRSYWAGTGVVIPKESADTFINVFCRAIVKKHIKTSAGDLNTGADIGYWKEKRAEDTAFDVLRQLREQLEEKF